MGSVNRKKRQVSVSLTEDEKVFLGKQSFKQNRSVSQIIRFAVKKYLDGMSTPAAQSNQTESAEELFTKTRRPISQKRRHTEFSRDHFD